MFLQSLNHVHNFSVLSLLERDLHKYFKEKVLETTRSRSPTLNQVCKRKKNLLQKYFPQGFFHSFVFMNTMSHSIILLRNQLLSPNCLHFLYLTLPQPHLEFDRWVAGWTQNQSGSSHPSIEFEMYTMIVK